MFRRAIKERKAEYIATKDRVLKSRIAKEVVHSLRIQKRTRFLRKATAKDATRLAIPRSRVRDAWCFVDEESIQEKAKQALRQKVEWKFDDNDDDEDDEGGNYDDEQGGQLGDRPNYSGESAAPNETFVGPDETPEQVEQIYFQPPYSNESIAPDETFSGPVEYHVISPDTTPSHSSNKDQLTDMTALPDLPLSIGATEFPTQSDLPTFDQPEDTEGQVFLQEDELFFW